MKTPSLALAFAFAMTFSVLPLPAHATSCKAVMQWLSFAGTSNQNKIQNAIWAAHEHGDFETAKDLQSRLEDSLRHQIPVAKARWHNKLYRHYGKHSLYRLSDGTEALWFRHDADSSRARKTVALYELDKLLHVHVTPVTVMRDETTVAQFYWDHGWSAPRFTTPLIEDIGSKNPTVRQAEVDHFFLDLLSGSGARGTRVLSREMRVVGIHSPHSFERFFVIGYGDVIRQWNAHHPGEKPSPRIIAALARTSEAELTRRLKPYIENSFEWHALVLRFHYLRRYFVGK